MFDHLNFSRPRDIMQGLAETWTRNTFGSATAENLPERAARMLEEAVELAQACGVPVETQQKIIGYVNARPVGSPFQEAGGVGLTLLSLCGALKISAEDAESHEVARVISLPAERFRKRDQEKHAAGISPGLSAQRGA